MLAVNGEGLLVLATILPARRLIGPRGRDRAGMAAVGVLPGYTRSRLRCLQGTHRGLICRLPVLGIQAIANRTANESTENDTRGDPRRATAYGRRQQPPAVAPPRPPTVAFAPGIPVVGSQPASTMARSITSASGRV